MANSNWWAVCWKRSFLPVRAIGVPFVRLGGCIREIHNHFKTFGSNITNDRLDFFRCNDRRRSYGKWWKQRINPVVLAKKFSSGLLGHWRFDEGQGSETYDSTGLTPTATLLSGVTWASGMGGAYKNALQFDGSSLAYADLGDFMIEGSLSFSAWVYKENLASWQRAFDFGSGAGTDNLLLANRDSSNQAEWESGGIFNRTLQVQDFWTLYEWQHVVAMVDESGE